MLTTKQDAANEMDMLLETIVGSAGSGMKTSNLETLAGYQQLVEALGDAVIICDCDGVIRLWNTAAERLFGFTPAEALGSSLDLIIPERLRERHWAGFTRTTATGQTRYQHDVLRVPAMHKDGRTLSIAFTVGLLLAAQRTVTGLVAVIRDETKRFAEERDLRKRLAELEGKHGA
jgi:PAS domain S-box-containing protein